jgi:hypothetical protein
MALSAGLRFFDDDFALLDVVADPAPADGAAPAPRPPEEVEADVDRYMAALDVDHDGQVGTGRAIRTDLHRRLAIQVVLAIQVALASSPGHSRFDGRCDTAVKWDGTGWGVGREVGGLVGGWVGGWGSGSCPSTTLRTDSRRRSILPCAIGEREGGRPGREEIERERAREGEREREMVCVRERERERVYALCASGSRPLGCQIYIDHTH